MYKKLFALVVVVVLVASLLAGCGAGSSATIKIGTIQPISGAISAFGTQSRDAINMAVEEINAAGGVLGKNLEVIVEDDEATPEKTVNAFKKLVTQDKIVGLVGALTSKCSLAITKEAQQRKLVMISPTSTNDTVTDAGDYIFRACYNDSFQGVVVAQFAFSNLKGKNAAILYDNTNDYSKGLTENFKKKFEELGGKIVAQEAYATGDKDFKAQITKIKGTNPDVLFIPDYYNTVALIAKQVRSGGMTIPMLGADGWDEITNNAGDEVIDCYYSNHYSPDSKDALVQDFVKKYSAKYNNLTPNALAALAYDATYILADAIKAAGSTDPEKLKAAMAKTDKKYVTGQIKFDAKRNPVKSAVMVKIQKGADGKLTAVYAETVNP
jgi:branched-chain amino acid transport system substrate-binding protein